MSIKTFFAGLIGLFRKPEHKTGDSRKFTKTLYQQNRRYFLGRPESYAEYCRRLQGF